MGQQTRRALKIAIGRRNERLERIKEDFVNGQKTDGNAGRMLMQFTFRMHTSHVRETERETERTTTKLFSLSLKSALIPENILTSVDAINKLNQNAFGCL